MRQTFITTMPDKAGAFLVASDILSSLGLNITRASYNKAVDAHMLFLEVEGDTASMAKAAQYLTANGYLQHSFETGRVILLELKLQDIPGSILPVLKLIKRINLNISYISTQKGEPGYQMVRMGLFVENNAQVSDFVGQVSTYCDVEIIEYDQAEKMLDNTAFYRSFANHISEKFQLSVEEKRKLILNANLIMDSLDKRNQPPYKTFAYIAKYANFLHAYRGDAFVPRITTWNDWDDLSITLIEPPCGSNLCVLDTHTHLLCVDGGYSCHQKELHACLQKQIPDFDKRPKVALLTHADVDHCGVLDLFDNTYLSRKCYLNFEREHTGGKSFREQTPQHAPFVRISNIFSKYHPPKLSKLRILGGSEKKLDTLLEKISVFEYGPLLFDVYEGCGGHVEGELIFIDRVHKILFPGDLFVNIKGFSPEQAAFNRLAPYLMTSVDTCPEIATREREAIFTLLEPGEWLLFGGHGAAKKVEIK